jgi:hypothetical protein
MNRTARLISTISATLALSLVGSFTAVAGEASNANVVNPIVQEGATDPIDISTLDPSEDYTVVVVDANGNDVASLNANSVTPFATWAACGISDSNTKLVRTFTRTAGAGLSSGSAYLRCGSDAWGLRHISHNHRTQWETLSLIGGSTSWRTFADWAFNEALRYPAHVTYRSSNDTYLYKTELQIRDSSGRVRDTKYANVSVARVSKNIITAFPTNS